MITIHCLVEDTTLPGAPFRAEHGMAWHITTPHGRILFDTGASGDVLLHNAALLGVDLAQIDALVLSHAHYDHTGGLRAVLDRVRPGLPLYASPDLFRPRYKTADDVPKFIGIALSREDLAARVDLRLSTAPQQVLPGVWTTGEITERPAFVGGSPNLLVRENGGYGPDPYQDDFSMVLQAAEGLVVLLGCGHAGLLNILRHVRQRFDGTIHTVAGGTHLLSATAENLQQALDELEAQYDAPLLYPCHCTGKQAFDTLHAAFGGRVRTCPPGTVLTFAAPAG